MHGLVLTEQGLPGDVAKIGISTSAGCHDIMMEGRAEALMVGRVPHAAMPMASEAAQSHSIFRVGRSPSI